MLDNSLPGRPGPVFRSDAADYGPHLGVEEYFPILAARVADQRAVIANCTDIPSSICAPTVCVHCIDEIATCRFIPGRSIVIAPEACKVSDVWEECAQKLCYPYALPASTCPNSVHPIVPVPAEYQWQASLAAA